MTLATYDRLISSVAGDYSRVSGHTIRKALGGNYIGWFFGAAKGDMNAAIHLLNNALPGWEWNRGLAVAEPGKHRATVWQPHENDALWKVFTASADNPARALLLAILKAKRSELEAGK